MIQERTRRVAIVTVLLDLAALVASFHLAYLLRDAVLPGLLPDLFPDPLFPLADYLWMYAVVLPAWVGLFFAFRLYSAGRLATFRRLLVDLARANAVGLGLVVAAAYLLKIQDLSRAFLVLFGIVNLLFISGGRLILRAALRGLQRRGRAVHNVLIVGTGPDAIEFARRMQSGVPWGLALLGMVAEDTAPEPVEGGPEILGSVHELERILTERPVDEVIFVIPGRTPDEFEDAFLLCEDLGVDARVVVGVFPHVIARARLEEFEGVPLLTFSTAPRDTLALTVKRTLDLAAGLLLFALGLVPGILIAIWIKLDSRGPALFSQERVGLHGRTFRMFKFRSMVADAEERRGDLQADNEMRGPVFKIRDDARVTRAGRWLRRTSLDELPQILNILRGEMSLVGPRPPIPREVEQYKRMKPGITCLWQVSGRNRIDFEEWMRLDLKYIDTWSLWLDFKILLRTIPAVLSGRGAS